MKIPCSVSLEFLPTRMFHGVSMEVKGDSIAFLISQRRSTKVPYSFNGVPFRVYGVEDHFMKFPPSFQ